MARGGSPRCGETDRAACSPSCRSRPTSPPSRSNASPTPSITREWLFEIKYDGFRGLAHVADGQGALVSRNANVMRRFRTLGAALGQVLRRHAAIVDGEIVCLGADGAPRFADLMFSRGVPCFVAFDLLWLDGEDLRDRPLIERKRRLRRLVGRGSDALHLVEPVVARGVDLFAEVCARDLEGIVAKWAAAPYRVLDGRSPWVKVKNRDYRQMRDRHELFARG